MAHGEQVGGFRDERAREEFVGRYRTAMERWPYHHDRVVTTSYGDTAVHVCGDGDGHPLVLLHGGNGTSASWAGNVVHWRTERPVYAIDTLGDAGHSVQEKPMRTPEDLSRWLTDVLTALGLESVHLLGLSYGGWIALNQAARDPSRLRTVTAIEPVRAIAGTRLAAWLRLLRLLAANSDAARLDYLRWVRAGRLPDEPMLSLLLSAQRDYVQRGTTRPQRLTDAQLAGVDLPLLVLLGGRSPLTPVRRTVRRLRKQRPSAGMRVLPHASHGLPADAPEETSSLVADFLRRHDTGQGASRLVDGGAR